MNKYIGRLAKIEAKRLKWRCSVNKNVEKLIKIIKESKSMVIFTGAGVSTESGVPDFRSKGGVFEQIEKQYHLSPEEMLSIYFFREDTKLFYEIYRTIFLNSQPQPNDCHRAFAELEKRGIVRSVVTQNIDNLHQLGGSKRVLEMHGNMFRNICSKCGKNFSIDYVKDPKNPIPKCDECGAIIRPDVVLYGEPLNAEVMTEAAKDIAQADAMLVTGTSLRVYPAAGFVDYFEGKNLVIVNRESTPYDFKARFVMRDNIGELMKEVMENL